MHRANWLICSLAVVLFLMGASALWSATLNVPADYPTIQAGIDAAVGGDTVLVAAGTYYESLLVTKPITLAGAGAESTIVDSQGARRCVDMASVYDPGLTVEGFTFTGAAQPTHWCVRMTSSRATLANNIITGNHSDLHAVYVEKAHLTLIGNTIASNTGGAWASTAARGL